MNVCLIPVHDRAELLYHTLRNIERAEGAADILYLFKPEHRTKPEVLGVMGSFKLPFNVIPYGQPPRIPGLMRQSWNVLTGYGIAARTAGEGGLVYMIESDVIVGKHFFELLGHFAGSYQDSFCAIGSEDTNTPPEDRPYKGDGAGMRYTSHSTYRSIGVCWRAEVLRDLIGPHCTTGYFLNPHAYIKSNFPVNQWGSTWCEQDGLIRRIQVNQPLPISYCYVPVCYHAGYYGGNRGNTRHIPKGTLQQRIDQVGEVIYSREAMRAHAPNQGYYLDSVPIEGITNPCLTLTA